MAGDEVRLECNTSQFGSFWRAEVTFSSHTEGKRACLHAHPWRKLPLRPDASIFSSFLMSCRRWLKLNGFSHQACACAYALSSQHRLWALKFVNLFHLNQSRIITRHDQSDMSLSAEIPSNVRRNSWQGNTNCPA